MQSEMNAPRHRSSNQSLNNHGFGQMAQSLCAAIAEFSEDSPTLLSSTVGLFRPLRQSSMKTWDLTRDFVRRHPVQTTIGIAAVSCAVAYLWVRPKASPTP